VLAEGPIDTSSSAIICVVTFARLRKGFIHKTHSIPTQDDALSSEEDEKRQHVTRLSVSSFGKAEVVSKVSFDQIFLLEEWWGHVSHLSITRLGVNQKTIPRFHNPAACTIDV